MNIQKKLLYMAGAALLLGTTSLFAADKSAVSIMNNAYQYLEAMDKYAFSAVVSGETRADKTYKQNVSAKVSRPNMLLVNSNGEVKNRTIYLDDGEFTMIDHNHNFYGQLTTPKSIDAALDFLFSKFDIKSPISSLFYSDMSNRVKFKRSKYFGTMDVAGIECDYIALKTKRREIHLWIATGDKPLIKTYSVLDIGSQGSSRTNTTIKWINNPDITESDFNFKAPKGASQISILRSK